MRRRGCVGVGDFNVLCFLLALFIYSTSSLAGSEQDSAVVVGRTEGSDFFRTLWQAGYSELWGLTISYHGVGYFICMQWKILVCV